MIDLNPMYESAGPQPSASNDFPIYSEVKKPGKANESTQQTTDIYAEVKKPKGKGANVGKIDCYLLCGMHFFNLYVFRYLNCCFDVKRYK